MRCGHSFAVVSVRPVLVSGFPSVVPMGRKLLHDDDDDGDDDDDDDDDDD